MAPSSFEKPKTSLQYGLRTLKNSMSGLVQGTRPARHVNITHRYCKPSSFPKLLIWHAILLILMFEVTHFPQDTQINTTQYLHTSSSSKLNYPNIAQKSNSMSFGLPCNRLLVLTQLIIGLAGACFGTSSADLSFLKFKYKNGDTVGHR